MVRGRRRPGDQVERLLDLAEAAALDRVAEELLVTEVVAVGIELEQPRADVAAAGAWA